MESPEGSNIALYSGPDDGKKIAEIVDGHILIVRLPKDTLAAVFDHNEAVPSALPVADNDNNDDGKNARGTFSKEHTLRHPETKWIHRGQGRYLPVDAVTLAPGRHASPRPYHELRYVKIYYETEITGRSK